jgi:hypothetical protein
MKNEPYARPMATGSCPLLDIILAMPALERKGCSYYLEADTWIFMACVDVIAPSEGLRRHSKSFLPRMRMGGNEAS